jgi:hypothetical protein
MIYLEIENAPYEELRKELIELSAKYPKWEIFLEDENRD